MFIFKEIKNNKKIYTPLISGLISFILIGLLIWIYQVETTHESPYKRSVVNFALMRKKSISEVYKPSYSGKNFKIFKEVLAHRESGGKYGIVNKYGYLGKYQFGESTLSVLGIKNTKGFLKNPTLQEMAFILNVSRNKWILRKEINRFHGKKIKDVLITESGIIAAAHLSGPGNVKTFLRSNGSSNVKDAFGTSLKNYMKIFGGYDISSVPAVRNPKL